MTATTISIIIVTYNSASTIDIVLKSITQQTLHHNQYNIVIVDNASSDNTNAIIEASGLHVQLIQLNKNIGFARANNLALKQITTPYVALINPDCVLFPDWLENMLMFLRANDNVALAGSKLYYSDGKHIQHIGGVISDNGLTQHIGESDEDVGQYSEPIDFPYVTGAAIFARQDLLKQVDFFDQRFFLYYEEVDLCVTLSQLGHRITYCPTAQAIHFEDKSLGHSQTTSYLFHYHRSRIKFVTKHSHRHSFLNNFCHAEKKWLIHDIRGKHRLIVLFTYLYCLSDIITVLLRRET